jgi:uncharacterized linocin/CFP29 family protein
MADYLQRALAPLSSEEWERLDKAVATAAGASSVSRSVLSVFGPLGAGHLVVPSPALTGVDPAAVNASGSNAITVGVRSHVPLMLVHKDFVLDWRDLESSRQTGLPLDLSAANAAATMCAVREDQLVFEGDRALGVDGLATISGHCAVTRRDWGIGGHAFLDVVEGVERQAQGGFYPPYALICSPNLYACLVRVYGSSGVLELQQVRELCAAGVYQSVHIKSALLLSVSSFNLDLAVGQDLTAGYVGSSDMNHVFRVMETIALRIKRPGAICALVPRTASPGHRVRRGVPEEATGAGD